MGILSKNKGKNHLKFVVQGDSKTPVHNQIDCLSSCTELTEGRSLCIMGPVYVDWLIKLAGDI